MKLSEEYTKRKSTINLLQQQTTAKNMSEVRDGVEFKVQTLKWMKLEK